MDSASKLNESLWYGKLQNYILGQLTVKKIWVFLLATYFVCSFLPIGYAWMGNWYFVLVIFNLLWYWSAQKTIQFKMGKSCHWLDLASFAWVRVWVHLQAQVKGGVFVFAAINHVRVWVDPDWIAAYWLCKYPIQSNRIDVDVYHIIIAGSHVNKCWVPAPWRDFKASPAQRSAASEISIENTHMTSVKHVRVCVGVRVCVCICVGVHTCSFHSHLQIVSLIS